MIAATLTKHGDATPAQLAEAALTLWQKCELVRVFYEMDCAKAKKTPPPLPIETPKNFSFPVKLEDALRLWLPDVKKGDRLKPWRDFLIENAPPAANASRDELEKGAAQQIEHDKIHGFSRPEFVTIGKRFFAWRKTAISKVRSKSGASGGRPKKD